MSKISGHDTTNSLICQGKFLLQKYSTSNEAMEGILNHSLAVYELAASFSSNITRKTGHLLDKRKIVLGSLLHDIGRFHCIRQNKDILWHGILGGDILKNENLPDIALIAERHIGAGLEMEEAKKAGLPLKDFLPQSLEEKIICHSDNFIFGTEIKNIQAVTEKFKREIGEKAVYRLLKMHEELKVLGAYDDKPFLDQKQ